MNRYNTNYTIDELKNIYNNEVLVNVPDDAKIARNVDGEGTSNYGNVYDTGVAFKGNLEYFIREAEKGTWTSSNYKDYACRYVAFYYNWKKNGNFNYKKENEYESDDSYIDIHDKRNYEGNHKPNPMCGKYVKELNDVVF